MKQILICIACLLISSSVWAEDEKTKVYRWIGDDGSLVFSSTPPPEGVKAEEVELRDADTIIHQERRVAPRQSYSGSDDVMRRADRRRAIKEQIYALEERIETARLKYQKGETPLEGERMKTLNGTRLSEEYFKRREREMGTIKALEKQLDQLWDQYNNFR